MGLIQIYKRNKLKKILMKQFKANIKLMHDDCLIECDKSGNVKIEVFNQAIKKVLVLDKKNNPITTGYNSIIIAMRSVLRKNNKTYVSNTYIRTIGEISIKKYKEFLNDNIV